MQNTSNLYRRIQSGEHHKEVKLSVYTTDGNTLVGEFDMSRIISMTTDRNVLPDDQNLVGNCISGQIDVRFLPTDSNGNVVAIPRMARLVPFVRLVNDYDVSDYSEWLQKGVYFVDMRETSANSRAISITGYDAMLKSEADYPSDSESNYPAADRVLVNKIAQAMGVSVDERTWDIITGDYNIGLPLGYSQREVLSAIAGSYAANFIITDTGKLLAIGIADLPAATRYLIDNVSGMPITFGGVRILV